MFGSVGNASITTAFSYVPSSLRFSIEIVAVKASAIVGFGTPQPPVFVTEYSPVTSVISIVLQSGWVTHILSDNAIVQIYVILFYLLFFLVNYCFLDGFSSTNLFLTKYSFNSCL